ncbi:MAG: LysR family transcriptional regulator [Candidatus Thermoplasmatota archaeon]|nr:LysR family transcriptional regulator [Candidatus Thermoplasmatota archaeon]
MNTDSLQVFVDLVSTLNLRKTADNFSISEATVSYRLRQLESFLGKDLFVRSSSKRIEITDFGKKFYPDAIKILRILDYHQSYGKSISPNGEIKISSGEIATIHFLPSLIESFEDKHP